MIFGRRTHIYMVAAGLLVLLLGACGPATRTGNETGIGVNAGDETGGDEDQTQPVAERNGPHFEIAEGSGTLTESGLMAGYTVDGHAFLGDPEAAVLMEEYSDFQCPFCSRFYEQTLPSITENQIARGEVVLVYYDFPLTSIHPQAFAASHAARCAGEEGVLPFWAMHDQLFGNINSWSGRSDTTEIFTGYASEIGIDTDAFAECMTSNRHNESIEADMDNAVSRGVTSTPSFFLNGSLLAGAQPISVFDQAIASVLSGETLVTDRAQPEAQQPAVAPTPAVISGEFAAEMGSPDAPITIVEYTDYQCPYCLRHANETMPQIVSNLVETGRARYVLKDFPLDSIHPDARFAAVAARCAGEQGAYWQMHDEIFFRQPDWAGQGDQASAVYSAIAEELGLEVRDFNSCLSSGRHDAAIEANLQEGAQLGVTGTPSFFISGYPIRGAQPYDLFEYAIGLAEEGTLADAYEPPAQQQAQATPAAPPEPIDVPIEDAVYSMGNADAPVVIVEYTDFQCPFCSRHHLQTLPQLISDYVESGQVLYVFKDFPLTSIHPQAVAAAEAARCAADQGAYLPMHDMLFERQTEWAGMENTTEIFAGYADEIGLDTETFVSCMESHQHQEAVMADLEEGSRFGVRGTPAFFLNGLPLSGAQPFSVFEQAISQLLAGASQ